jgi:uncharacterized FlgJ-related protein
LEAVNKFDEERQLMTKDYELYSKHVAELKEIVHRLSTENTNLKRKLAFEQSKNADKTVPTTTTTNQNLPQSQTVSSAEAKGAQNLSGQLALSTCFCCLPLSLSLSLFSFFFSFFLFFSCRRLF